MLFESCQLRAKRIVNPIIDWSTRDVWDFIHSEHLNVNCLYEEGYERVGCIGCPMARKKRYAEFRRWPEYKRMYLRAFDRMLKRREEMGKNSNWESAEEVFDWWMEEDMQMPGQMELEGKE